MLPFAEGRLCVLQRRSLDFVLIDNRPGSAMLKIRYWRASVLRTIVRHVATLL